MAIFKKPDGAPPNGDNGKPPVPRSRWQMQIDHYAAIEKHGTAIMDLNSMMNFDMQKLVDFARRSREILTTAFEESGGTVEQGSVEEQIKEFLPKALQRERVDEAN